MTTLITVSPERNHPGAVPTGGIARRLAARLVARGEAVRVLTPETATPGWPAGIELVPGDVTVPDRVPEVFDAIDRLFLAGAVPETVREVVRRAEDGGVRRIVLLTSHGPEYEIEMPPDAWYWLAVEVVVERSSAEWVRVLPSAVMESLLGRGYPSRRRSLPEIVRDGSVLREPYPHAGTPYVHEDDVAAVAAVALFDPGHAGQVLRASGRPVSRAEMLRTIGQRIGREIRLEELRPDQARALWRAEGWPEEDIEHTLAVLEYFATHDEPADHTIDRLLGRPPRSFAEWVAEHAGLFE